MSNSKKNDVAWAVWIAKNFAVSRAEKLQRFIERRDGPLPAYSWRALSRAIQSDDLEDEVLDRWVSLLLSKIPVQVEFSEFSLGLSALGRYCDQRDLTRATGQIFEAMAKMDSSKGKRVQFFWYHTLKPRLDQYASHLINFSINKIKERHHKLSANKKSDSMLMILMSFLLESLYPGGLSASIDVGMNLMICVARDSLDWIVENRREDRADWQSRIANSESPILRCLAAHSVRMDDGLLPDEKAAWLLETNPLLEVKRINDRPPYKELDALAEEIYPRLDEERRGAMIEAITEYRFFGQGRERDEKIEERHRYDWYHILHRSAPECPLAGQAFEEAQRSHPEWKPTADFGIQSRRGSPSSLLPEQLLARQGSEWASELPALFIQVSEGPEINDSVRGLSEAVRKAAKQDFDWGLALADGLASANEWETDVWSGLIQAWSSGENTVETDLDKDEYREVLNWMENENLQRKEESDFFITRTINSLVVNGGAPYALELLSDTNRIAASLWDKIDHQDVERSEPYFLVDERPAASLARYWLNGLLLLHKDPDSAPEGLEQDCAEALSKIAQDPSPKGLLGRLTLAQRFDFLHHVKKEWTIENLLPLFSSSNDKEFQAVWEGLLTMQRPGKERNLTDETAKILYRPSYKAVKRILPDNKMRTLFVRHYTEMVLFVVKNPMKRWLPEFFKRSNRENRREFTNTLDWYIRFKGNKSNRLRWWDQWLESYWKNRIQGVPKPLDAVEMGRMLSWPLHFGPYMPEAVDLAVQMKPDQQNETVEEGYLFFELKKLKIWSNYPKATAKLLLHLGNLPLSPGASMGLRSEGSEIIDNLLALNLPDDLKRDLEDLRATLS